MTAPVYTGLPRSQVSKQPGHVHLGQSGSLPGNGTNAATPSTGWVSMCSHSKNWEPRRLSRVELKCGGSVPPGVGVAAASSYEDIVSHSFDGFEMAETNRLTVPQRSQAN